MLNSASRNHGMQHHGKIFFCGVVLPLIAVLFETTTHFCAKHYFDPFPSTSHILLFLFIPLSNYLTLLATRRNLSEHYGFLSLLSGMAMGMGAMYSLMFMPIFFSSLFFVGAFGFGLLGLTPFLSLPSTWQAGKRICALAHERKTYFDAHQVEHIGHLIILVMVLAVELPSTLTRVNLGTAASTNTEASSSAIAWLRKYGNEEVMLRACYERSGRATDIVGSIYEAGHPLQVETARRIFYQVTGKAFNSVPIPASARATIQHSPSNDPGGLNANVDDEFDLDMDIAGETVSGVARGLSIAQSKITGTVYGDAMLAELDWNIALNNKSNYDREARAKIQLPPGAVITKAFLNVYGKEHETTIMVREEARAVYQQSVLGHKEDPLLVSTCGPDQVLVQCYPVHPATTTIIKLHIVTPLTLVQQNDATFALPTFSEKNFQDDIRSTLTLTSSTPLKAWSINDNKQQLKESEALKPKPQSAVYQLSTDFAKLESSNFQPIIHAERNSECKSVYCHDTYSSTPTVVQHFFKAPHAPPPKILMVLIDGSVSMTGSLEQIAEGLARLPKGTKTTIMMIKDKANILCTNALPTEENFKKALASLKKTQPEGGQLDGQALVNCAKTAVTDDASVLWIHATQPICAASIKEQLRTYLLAQHDSTVQKKILYDMQISAGPTEALSDIPASRLLFRVAKTGSIEQDLSRLYEMWESQDDNSVEFAQQNALVLDSNADNNNNNNNNSKPQEAPPALAQIYANERIKESLTNPNLASEAIQLARVYHLVSPISSAVVVDEDPSLTPIPKPILNPLKKILSSNAVENSFRCMSPFMNKTTELIALIVASPLTLGGCSSAGTPDNSAVNKSFSTITNQLNQLNKVTSVDYADKNTAAKKREKEAIRDERAQDSAAPPSASLNTKEEAKSDAGASLAPIQELDSINDTETRADTSPVSNLNEQKQTQSPDPSKSDNWVAFADAAIVIFILMKLRNRRKAANVK